MTVRRLARVLAWPVFARRILRDGKGMAAPAEAIFVAGAKVRPDGGPSLALTRRVALGVRLFQAGWAPSLVWVGRGAGPRPEADVMFDLARELGVPASAMIRERHSMTTAENARYAFQVAPVATALVVTDDTHLRRCVREFAAHFPSVRGVGAPTRGSASRKQVLREAMVEAWREG